MQYIKLGRLVEILVADVDAKMLEPIGSNLKDVGLYYIHLPTYLAKTIHDLKYHTFGVLLDYQQGLNGRPNVT